jgi:hypothetical protein
MQLADHVNGTIYFVLCDYWEGTMTRERVKYIGSNRTCPYFQFHGEVFGEEYLREPMTEETGRLLDQLIACIESERMSCGHGMDYYS